MISTSSRKAKGRRLQNKVRDLILEKFDLHPDDVRGAIMGESGEDIKQRNVMSHQIVSCQHALQACTKCKLVLKIILLQIKLS